MTFDQLFALNAHWKHREREFRVFIREVVEPGKYRLSFVDNKQTDFVANSLDSFILRGIWTAEELIRDFDPMPVQMTRYDHIADDTLLDDES